MNLKQVKNRGYVSQFCTRTHAVRAQIQNPFTYPLLHNYFFADTAYRLLGFHISDSSLYAVVQQPYIKADSLTDLQAVKDFMLANGFKNKRRNDYKMMILA